MTARRMSFLLGDNSTRAYLGTSGDAASFAALLQAVGVACAERMSV